MTLTKSQKQQLWIMISVATVVMGGIAIGTTTYAPGSLWNIQSAEISIDEAAAIAITHLNTESSNLVEIGIEKEEGNSFTYEAEFEIGDQEISVEIHPQTGEILEVEKETIEQEEENDDDEETDQEESDEEIDQEKDDDD